MVPVFKQFLAKQNILAVFEKPLLQDDLHQILKQSKIEGTRTMELI